MARGSDDIITDEEVEIEIERLRSSEAVKLAQKERQWKYKRRQYMYTLRWYEKRGRLLMAQGRTMEDFSDSDPEDLMPGMNSNAGE